MIFWVPFLIIYVVLYFIKSDKAKLFQWRMDKFYPWFMVLATVIGISTTSDSFLYNQAIALFAAVLLTMPYNLVVRIKKHRKMKALNAKATLERAEAKNEKLPEKSVDREKIVRKFNEQYSLNLTDEQIQNIVNGSFMSQEWADEIRGMNEKYINIAEWYAGDTDWLRAYLKSFTVQNVTGDFAYQESICVESFREIFSAANVSSYASLDECIEAVNMKFFTNFDDLSFMVAYRFLEKHGMHFELPRPDILNAHSEIDNLAKKYDNMEQEFSQKTMEKQSL